MPVRDPTHPGWVSQRAGQTPLRTVIPRSRFGSSQGAAGAWLAGCDLCSGARWRALAGARCTGVAESVTGLASSFSTAMLEPGGFTGRCAAYFRHLVAPRRTVAAGITPCGMTVSPRHVCAYASTRGGY